MFLGRCYTLGMDEHKPPPPATPRPGRRLVLLTIRLTPEQRDRLKLVAWTCGQSLQVWAEEALLRAAEECEERSAADALRCGCTDAPGAAARRDSAAAPGPPADRRAA
jgi:predicted DNA-binding protein